MEGRVQRRGLSRERGRLVLRSEALRLLGLRDDHDEAALRAAYAEKLKAQHPDTGGDDHARSVARLRKAKDFLAARFKEASLPACEPCKGKGVIKGLSKFGTTCKACQGTGLGLRR